MRITGLDHIVLDVADVRRSLDFYVGTLGLEPMQVDEWEAGAAFFPSVRIDEATIIDLLQADRTGQNLDHLCLVVEDDVEALAAAGDLDVVEGPVVRSGARGDGLSVYVRDPDGNLLELKNYR
jgi:catechol 2,3-dioxygenase-like lactoylglutathione lyase family enzyme